MDCGQCAGMLILPNRHGSGAFISCCLVIAEGLVPRTRMVMCPAFPAPAVFARCMPLWHLPITSKQPTPSCGVWLEPLPPGMSSECMDAWVLGMQALEEENQELAALLAEWDDGDASYGSAQDSPRTSLLQSQQHQYLQQHQQVRAAGPGACAESMVFSSLRPVRQKQCALDCALLDT